MRKTASDPPVPQPGEGKRGEQGYLGYLLRQASVAVRTRMERDFSEEDVTPPQFAVLTMVRAYPGLSNADLARLSLLTPQTVSVIPKLDSIGVLGAARDTVFAPDSLSDSLRVQAYALGGAIPANRRVVFTKTTFPARDSLVTLPSKDTVYTNSSTGVAAVRVRLHNGPVPDSVVVTATMQHVNRTPVQGSPLTFVVEFRP